VTQNISHTLSKEPGITLPLAVHDIYHDDVIVEFPQSGERISGKHNEYELWKHYPSKPGFKILKVCGEGSLWVTELIITYDDGRPVNG